MRSLLLASLALASLLPACHPSGGDQAISQPLAVRDTNWIGEARITAGDTLIRLCGTGKRYRLTGHALDSIVPKYRYFNTRPGQWMKVWCTGHLGAIGAQGRLDSALITGAYQHLDASRQCDPVPNERMSGSYTVDFQDPAGHREVRMDLFPDGGLTMYTTNEKEQLPVEENGRWGLDCDDHVLVQWPQRDQSMKYQYTEGRMTSDMPGQGNAVVLLRQGPPDRMHGAFGRTAVWLAAEATANGRPTKADDLLPGMTLKTLFPTDAARQALRTSARDSLGLDDKRLRLEWDAVENVQDAVALMRMRMRSPH